ncbi:hypothetical protein BLNAU_12603 [Blattamonas nauphoetae]|uniref:Uncharacterized protein n=1 Tax=Blattamonas nauphoetae TaxID=2049346 RepID=A0ABQ9XQS0_9EUKA|nr:hypothetical protein BLNAU_12603 [Blattamonas nauphoetae]
MVIIPSTHKARLSSQASQILVSCVIEGSTNHFSGTATADINTYGSFVSHNSSISTSGLVISSDVPAKTREIKVSRYTFKTMSGSASGSAISTRNSLGKTTVHEFSFYDCRLTGLGGAALAFGQEPSTDNHFVLKISDAAARKANSLEQAKNTLPWLISVVVATVMLLLLIIFLICRQHRNQKKDKDYLLLNQGMGESDSTILMEKMEVVDTPHYVLNAPNTNNVINNNIPSTAFGSKPVPARKMNSHDEATRMSMHGRPESDMKIAVRCGVELEETPVNKNDTLSNTLHKRKRQINTQHVFRIITRGIAQLAKQNPQMPILTRLSLL